MQDTQFHCNCTNNNKYLGLKEENPSLLEETECGTRLDIGWPIVRILG